MASLKQCGLILTLCVGIVFGSSCSPQTRADNPAGCVAAVKAIMTDTSAFWFGTNYSTKCPNGPADGYLCSNYNPDKVHSLAERLIPGAYDADLLTTFIQITFTSPPGQYTGCGNTFTESQTSVIDIDPTSSRVDTPWFLRQTPEVTWDYSQGEYYSLYVYAVGYYITHAVYINIQGNEMPTSGENVIDAYHGPLVTNNFKNPYVFMVFRQNGYLDPAVAKEWYDATHAPGSLATKTHIPDFMTLLNMTGPIGINWISATGDAYAAATMGRVLSTCPIFIGQSLDEKPRPFLPNPSELTVKMDVTFDVTELSYSACCVNFRENARTLTLNPIGNELLLTSAPRTGLIQNVTFQKVGYASLSYMLTGERYTLIALDPDVPYATVGTEARPLLHQMKINIMDGDFTTGEDVITWNGPAPPDDQPHYYYFLLYKHAQPVSAATMMSYAGNCGERLAGRCLFDINRAVSENDFTLVGANWFRSVKDPYVRYRNIQSDPNSVQAQCAGQPGYTVDCITSSASFVHINYLVILVALISYLFL